MEKPKVELGQLVMTRGVRDRCDQDKAFYRFIFNSLGKYVEGDLGDVSDKEREKNEEAVKYGYCVRAAYSYNGNAEDKILIYTEYDRSATVILLPYEK